VKPGAQGFKQAYDDLAARLVARGLYSKE
jgi:hypothetical protein